MPTAVERLLDAFLKLDSSGGDRPSESLSLAFAKIDSAFKELATAPNTDTFLKDEHKGGTEFDFDEIGGAFDKVWNDFLKIGDAGLLMSQFFDKHKDAILKDAPGSGDVTIELKADFQKLDQALTTSADDIKIVGKDFIKLDGSPNVEAFTAKLKGSEAEYLKISVDMTADAAAFLKLSGDFFELASSGGDRPTALDIAFKNFGNELKLVASEFNTLATDWNNLADALLSVTNPNNPGGGGGVITDTTVGSATGGSGSGKAVGLALMTLFQDFHTLGTGLAAVGQGFTTISNDLTGQGQGGQGQDCGNPLTGGNNHHS